MDNAVLTPIAAELAAALAGATVGDVVQIDSRRFALRFNVPPFHRLCVTLHPDLSAIHLARRVASPKEPTELAVALSDHLAGASLAAVGKDPGERVVELLFDRPGGDRAFVVVELLGKASNLLLLDADRRIVRYARTHAGAFRRPREGDPYAPPPRREESAGSLPWGSRLLAREAAAGASRADLEARMAAGAWAPCLYTPVPPGDLAEGDPLAPDACFAAPFPLSVGSGLARTDHASANEAAAAHTELMLRYLLFSDLRGALSSLVRGELERAERLEAALLAEQAAARGAGEIRRRAELILASLATARKEGDAAVVTDHFDPAAPQVRIPIDPKLDLRGNAEALFRRARKLQRAASLVAGRLAATRGRAEALRRAGARVAAAASTPEVEALEAELSRSGLARAVRQPARRELGLRPSFVRFREYRTRDGHVVLVGRSGADNDTLTFKVAAPHDFWLHAAGRPGAHVVVRNPKRAKELPEPALTEAAAIAAWFSRGDRGQEIDVHVAQRKEVRKGKGMSPGMVMLRNHRTVRVRPAPPAGAGEGEDVRE